MSNSPLVSIIIPVFNVESEYLRVCIDSALGQSYANLEILLIDDKSTHENVLPILEEYARSDARVKLVKNGQNKGVSFVRKQGIDSATGDFVSFLDCDDRLEGNCVELLLDKELESNADVVLGDYWMVYDSSKKYCRNSCEGQGSFDFLKALLTGKCGGTIWSKLFKRNVLKEIHYPLFEGKDNDVVLNFHLACAGLKIVSLNIPVYNWIQRKTSVTQTKSQATINHGFTIVSEVCKLVESRAECSHLREELALYKMSAWALLLAQGIKLNDSNRSFRDEINRVYLKNKLSPPEKRVQGHHLPPPPQAVNKLRRSQRIILEANKYTFTRYFYLLYMKTVKTWLARLRR